MEKPTCLLATPLPRLSITARMRVWALVSVPTFSMLEIIAHWLSINVIRAIISGTPAVPPFFFCIHTLCFTYCFDCSGNLLVKRNLVMWRNFSRNLRGAHNVVQQCSELLFLPNCKLFHSELTELGCITHAGSRTCITAHAFGATKQTDAICPSFEASIHSNQTKEGLQRCVPQPCEAVVW